MALMALRVLKVLRCGRGLGLTLICACYATGCLSTRGPAPAIADTGSESGPVDGAASTCLTSLGTHGCPVGELVIRSQAEWSAFTASKSAALYTWAQVDFNSSMVLAVGKGTSTLPGKVRIGRLRPRGQRLVAEYVDCSGNAMALSFGCHVVDVPRDDREVVFERLGGEARDPYCMCE